MQKYQTKKSKKLKVIIIILIFSIGIILYKLADRYLIEHIQINNAFAGLSDIGSTTFENPTIKVAEPAETAGSEGTKAGNYVNDDWNYNDPNISIHIDKISKGMGSGMITYYTADVVLKNSDSLKTAFAKNQFGTNIVQDTSAIAKENNAIFAINGDYYGFRNDGIIIRNREIFRDNPARTGLAIYNDGSMKSYDEASTTAQKLIDEGVVQTFSFGPSLMENSLAINDFGKTVIDTNFGNRSIQDDNPRTGIGIISDNHYVFIVVDGRSPGYSKGMTLSEFAKVFEDLGCKDAYNLDGGGSSTMYFKGRVVNNPLGKGNERGVSDIIYIK